jgi:hypothetical protein
MGDPLDNLILIFLRRIDENVDWVRADMTEVKECLGLLEAGYIPGLLRNPGIDFVFARRRPPTRRVAYPESFGLWVYLAFAQR